MACDERAQRSLCARAGRAGGRRGELHVVLHRHQVVLGKWSGSGSGLGAGAGVGVGAGAGVGATSERRQLARSVELAAAAAKVLESSATW